MGATAKQEKYLYLGAPLLGGVAIVALSGLAPLVLPVTAVRTLALTESLWLYGGLAVFGGFTLYDVQKILHHARLSERGLMRKDAVNESISLELDVSSRGASHSPRKCYPCLRAFDALEAFPASSKHVLRLHHESIIQTLSLADIDF